MSWARYDDEFPMNHKVGRLVSMGKDGLAAIGLHLLANTYARHNGTAGVIEPHVPNLLCGSTTGRKLARILAEVGMFDDRDAGGWTIHDYAEYHDPSDPDPDRSAADRKRDISEKRAAAGRRGGLAKAKQTSSKASSLLDDQERLQEQAEPWQPASKRQATTKTPSSNRVAKTADDQGRSSKPVAKAKQCSSPVPDPVPSSSTHVCPRPHWAEDDDEAMDKYRAIVEHLATLRTSRASARDPRAYRRKVLANIEADDGEQIRSLMQRYPQAPYDVIAGALETGDDRTLAYYAPTDPPPDEPDRRLTPDERAAVLAKARKESK